MSISEQALAECAELAARYPQPRSALLPMLHVLQAEEGRVTPAAIEACAQLLDLSTAEVSAVATFYTMYRRNSEGGRHHIGVCINTGCGLLGGDAVYEAVSRRLGVDHNETTADGMFTLERIECQAACTHAPVMTVDWEFFDRTTVESALDVIERLSNSETVTPTRGPAVRGWRAAERTIAGIDDGLADDGGGADDLMLAGLRAAREQGHGEGGQP